MSKRIFDIMISMSSLIILFPILFIVAVIIAIKLGWPVFFVQRRTGKNGVHFQMIKFRTMTNGKDINGSLLPNDQRMTKFGNMLRSMSMDELPELLNVLVGHMSIVGPRPLLPEYDALYSEEHAKRLSVAPGITGWAQINGRSASKWSERFDQDVWYVERRNFFLDLRIILLTIKSVFMRKDITTPDQNKRFEGYGK